MQLHGSSFGWSEAELVGIDGLTFGIFDGVVLVNTANDTDGDANTTAVKLDWTTFGTGKRGMTVPLLTDVDADIDLHIEGSVALDAFGVLIAKGSFSVTLGQVTDAAWMGCLTRPMTSPTRRCLWSLAATPMGRPRI